MRCLCCNSLMTDDDLHRTNIHTKAPEDLCIRCLEQVQEPSLAETSLERDDREEIDRVLERVDFEDILAEEEYGETLYDYDDEGMDT